MKILLFGKNGQLSKRLYQTLLPVGDVTVVGSDTVDFTDLSKLKKYLRDHPVDVIVNAAAYTAVDKAESESQKAFAINAEAVKLLAEAANKNDSLLIHYSSDYVFDGTKVGAYTENDKPNPLNVYGKSKALGDAYIQASGCLHVIMRTTWVFDSHGNNFAKAILARAKKDKVLRVVDDQFGVPTSAAMLANITALVVYQLIDNFLLSEEWSGIYNVVPSGETSWYGFAGELIKQAQAAGMNLCCLPEDIIPITSAEYPTPAKRPLNSRLNTAHFRDTFDINLPSWEVYIPFLIEELKNNY